MAYSKLEQDAYNRAYYQKNKDKIKSRVKEYKKNSGYKYKLSEQQKEQSRERARRWYQANKQVMIDRSKDWKAVNKEKVNAGSRSYASRRRGAIGNYTVKDFIKLKNNHRGICAYCNQREANSIDHVVPLSRGGTNYIGNILPVCSSCNSSKRDKNLFTWRMTNGRVHSI